MARVGHSPRRVAAGRRTEELLFARLHKEAIHELGHVLGLLHCPDPSCVMRASTYVEDVDGKPAAYCTPCLRIVRRGGRVPHQR